MKGLTKKKISRKVSKKNRKTNMKGGSDVYSNNPVYRGFVRDKQKRLNFEKQQQENKIRQHLLQKYVSLNAAVRHKSENNARIHLNELGLTKTHEIVKYTLGLGPGRSKPTDVFIIKPNKNYDLIEKNYNIPQPPPKSKVPQPQKQKYNPDNSAAKAAKAAGLSTSMSSKSFKIGL